MRAARAEWPWISATVAGACVLLSLAPTSLAALMAFDRDAILHGEWWRLWGAHLVHFSLPHALTDAATFLIVATLAESEFGSRRIALLLFAGAGVISLGLLFVSPALLEYRGASAIAVMLAAVVGISRWRTQASARAMLSVLMACLIAKIVFDAIGMSATLTDLPDRVRVAWQAHLLGAALGGFWYFANTRGAHERAIALSSCLPSLDQPGD
jgi:rhomboid family GlyGly-CTERM serine protease